MAAPARRTNPVDVDADRGSSLVLDGQRSRTPAGRGWCERGPDHLRIVTADGYFRPRCKRRDCPRCYALRSRELARCLLLDARAELPTVCVTLTTNDPASTPATYRNGSARLFARLRRRYGRVEYFGGIEFTTGRARSSGGHRRLHGHYLVKGLHAGDSSALETLVRESWRKATGAWVVEVAPLASPGAALGYLGLHHRKPEQAPPAQWRGMTERASRGYWHQPIAELRAHARAELAAEAHAHRTGLPLEQAALEVAAREPGRLVEVRRLSGTSSVLQPLGPPRWAQ